MYELQEMVVKKSVHNNEQPQWYAMRVTYNREMSVKHLLEAASFVFYLPMRFVIKLRQGKKVRLMEPAVRGLMFVKSTFSELLRFKSKLPHLQFMTRKYQNRNVPIVVSPSQMDAFIKATSVEDGSIEYFESGQLNLAEGTRVRVHGGELDGIEGIYKRVSGRRARRLVIQVENVLAIAIDLQSVNFIEVLK